MKNFSIERIKRIAINNGLASICIILLFICSFCNHNSVNRNCMINIESLSENFEETKTNIEILVSRSSHECIGEKNTESISKELNSLLFNIKNTEHELIKLFQNIFDANTVTFLITFLSAIFFTLFITYIIRNIKLFEELEGLKKDQAHTKKDISNKIKEAGKRIKEVDNSIAEAKKDWDIKIQNQEYLLKIDTKRNSLIQILNLVSVLGSHLASSSYVIKPEYITLVYMIQRKTQSLIEEGFEEIKTIRPEDQTEFYRMITDCITYLNIDSLRDNNKDGLVAFEQLDASLGIIRTMINNIPLEQE